MKFNKLKFGMVTGLICVTTLVFSFKEDLFLVSKNLDIFASLYKEVNVNYVEDTNVSDLMRTSIDAMLDGLDPYTEYIPESEIEDYKLKYVSTQYGGIGAGTLFIDHKLFVNEVSEGNPANKQDVKPGDQIFKINGIETTGKDRNQISQLLRGPKKSSVTLTLIRDGITLNKTLVREEIKQPNVSYYSMVGDQIGYIKLDKFLENSGQEVKDALVSLNKEQAKGIILDLRNNGGGILQEAVKIVNLFVQKDLMVVVQKGRNPEKTVSYKTLNEPIAPQIPLVVLINGSSASASEIVAGALQDLDRAVIIGQRSYGKGLVQQTFNLPYNSLVKITVAKYFIPSGRCIQALDYAHKDQSGVAEKFADSTMKAFSTKSGRMVFNGNGVYPDLPLSEMKLSGISASLLTKNLFFDYANSYRKEHKQVADAKSFQITDADYNVFMNSLSNKDYSYNDATESILKDFVSAAEKEHKLNALKNDVDALKQKMQLAKKNDLVTHKAEIKRILETQIISRFYYEKGKIEQSFQYDKEVINAKTLFANPDKLATILKGDGAYKIIGSPIKAINSTN